MWNEVERKTRALKQQIEWKFQFFRKKDAAIAL
jgi:hypothetical protein